MYIHDLNVGGTVTLEMQKGSSVYEVCTSVVGSANDGREAVLLKPFTYKGKVLDLGKHGFEGIRYNLIVIDDLGNRIAWNNVDVKIVNYRGENYYSITTKQFNSISAKSERRDNIRMPIDTQGTLNVRKSGEQYTVNIKDISDNGVGIVNATQLPIVGATCIIEFTENVNHKEYNLKIDCKCVREQPLDAGYQYGFSVSEASNQMLAYVYIKKILAKNGER